ncbi:hypothetical protein WLQ65_03780 [Pseudoalteromonas piscicida]|uniref:hypothetical protein n=1 Tax=Pseudoalteromonas piscicida TaxID=43662 RepID=UPI0030C9D953
MYTAGLTLFIIFAIGASIWAKRKYPNAKSSISNIVFLGLLLSFSSLTLFVYEIQFGIDLNNTRDFELWESVAVYLNNMLQPTLLSASVFLLYKTWQTSKQELEIANSSQEQSRLQNLVNLRVAAIVEELQRPVSMDVKTQAYINVLSAIKNARKSGTYCSRMSFSDKRKYEPEVDPKIHTAGKFDYLGTLNNFLVRELVTKEYTFSQILELTGSVSTLELLVKKEVDIAVMYEQALYIAFTNFAAEKQPALHKINYYIKTWHQYHVQGSNSSLANLVSDELLFSMRMDLLQKSIFVLENKLKNQGKNVKHLTAFSAFLEKSQETM